MGNRLRRWLLLDLKWVEFYDPPWYYEPEEKWYPGVQRMALTQIKYGKCDGIGQPYDSWMCKRLDVDSQISLRGMTIRRFVKKGLFWRVYLFVMTFCVNVYNWRNGWGWGRHV